MTINFDITNRFTGSVQFVATIECDESTTFGLKVGLAVKWAIKNHADLTDADLRGAVLTDAVLTDADLRGADLTDAVLTRAVLTRADLRGADLRGADLTDADLRGADLRGADLTDAVLTDAVLRGAVLTRADLSDKQLRNYKHDFWGILIQFKDEIPALKKHIIEGKIDGSVYSETCACLMGTIANIKDCEVDDLPKDSGSYIESWFMMIKPGHTPENNFASKKALEWLEEFVGLLNHKEKQ